MSLKLKSCSENITTYKNCLKYYGFTDNLWQSGAALDWAGLSALEVLLICTVVLMPPSPPLLAYDW